MSGTAKRPSEGIPADGADSSAVGRDESGVNLLCRCGSRRGDNLPAADQRIRNGIDRRRISAVVSRRQAVRYHFIEAGKFVNLF